MDLSIGKNLKYEREKQGILLADASRELKVPEKSLRAIEEEDWAKLPALVYARGFLRLYADYLGLDGEAVAREYETIYRSQEKLKEHSLTPKQLRHFRRTLPVLTPRMTAFAGICLAVLLALGYLFFEVRGFTRAPALTVNSPAENMEITDNEVLVRGKTDATAEVKINGEKTFVGSDGSFEEKIGVGSGLNKISVSAKSIGGKESVVTREVLVREESREPVANTGTASPQPASSPQSATKTNDLKVRAEGESVWVSVASEENILFSGILKDGEEKQFTGKKFSVTAGKANKVLVKIGDAEWRMLGENPGVARNIEVDDSF